MKFYKRLYIGEKIKYPDLVKWKLRHHAGQPTVWCVTLPEQADMPEILHSMYLKSRYYRENPPLIIGIAGSRDDAIELVRMIVEEAVRADGDPDVRKFLFPHGVRVRRSRSTAEREDA